MQYLGGVRSKPQTLEYLDRNVGHWRQHGFGIWILRLSGSGEFVGRAGLRFLEIGSSSEVEIGWGLRPAFWGQGLAAEIARECLVVTREILGFDTIVATAQPENIASLRVMERLGMSFERRVFLGGIELDLYRLRLDGPSNSRLQPTLADARAAEPPNR